MVNLFHEIIDAQVILHCKGVYQQVPVFRRRDRLYAKKGAGFVRIGGHGFTSAPTVSWEDLDIPSEILTKEDTTGAPVLVRINYKEF